MRRAGLVLLTMYAASVAALGQDQAGDDLPTLIRNLDSAQVDVRTKATDQILGSRDISTRQIEEALRGPNLSPEQRQRLMAIAAMRFRTSPRAAMGLRNEPNAPGMGVTVGHLVQGFPSAQVLRLNDRITAAAGMVIDNSDRMEAWDRRWDLLRAIIVSRDPGDEIPLTIVRDGTVQNVTVKLGEYSRLNQQGAIEPGILEAAWAIRCRSLQPPAASVQPPLESGLVPADWQRAGAPDDAADLILGGDPTRTPLVAGGEPRSGLAPRPMPTQLTRRSNTRLAPGQRPFNPNLPGDAAQVQARLRQQQLDSLWQVREGLAAQLAASNERLRDPATPESARTTLRAEVKELVEAIRIRDLQIQTLQAEMRRP